jgi:signal transduction histidine kinase
VPSTVRLDADDHAVVFEVADEGPGFNVSETARGMGLSIMQDRVDALDGELRVESRPNDGTKVMGRIPLRGADQG